jgi:hypothetical protein
MGCLSDDFIVFTIIDGLPRHETVKRRFYKTLVRTVGLEEPLLLGAAAPGRDIPLAGSLLPLAGVPLRALVVGHADLHPTKPYALGRGLMGTTKLRSSTSRRPLSIVAGLRVGVPGSEAGRCCSADTEHRSQIRQRSAERPQPLPSGDVDPSLTLPCGPRVARRTDSCSARHDFAA